MGLAGVKKKQRISLDPQNKTWKDGTQEEEEEGRSSLLPKICPVLL